MVLAEPPLFCGQQVWVALPLAKPLQSPGLNNTSSSAGLHSSPFSAVHTHTESPSAVLGSLQGGGEDAGRES